MFRIDLRMHGRHRRWWHITALEMDSIGAHASMERSEFRGKGAWIAGRYPIAA